MKGKLRGSEERVYDGVDREEKEKKRKKEKGREMGGNVARGAGGEFFSISSGCSTVM